MKLVLMFLTALSILTAATAYAEEPDSADEIRCATIKKTSDGYLALRREPTSSSPMKAKLRTGWYIVLDPKVGNGDWARVTYVEELDNHQPVDAKPTRGWVYSKYIKLQECAC
jgi:hypothetical protein